ncbi:hypothetical protein DL768_008404 [Monosporascus sp. mg162]|nr:hypothetical protein DL768_008404 [Monosporascus sp. mg162]
MSSRLENEASFEATNLGFLYRQFTRPKPLPTGVRLTDQVAIVTGSNVGLGLEACRQLLALGLSQLVMAVRSQSKGETAAGPLRKQFPNSIISVWVLDLESYDSIRAFVARCTTLPRIDIAILNAALMKPTYTTVPETGRETTIQVNYLSTALLSILLLPILRDKRIAGAPRPPVLSIVGSDLAWRVDIETRGQVLQQFERPEAYSQFPWYGRSKLLLTFFISKLAEFVSPDDVIVNMPNPGTTKGTAFFREFPTLAGKLVAVLQFLLARPVDVGASIL